MTTELSAGRIKELLDRIGMTSREFRTLYWGKDTQQTLSYFNRSSNVTLGNLIKLCSILGVTPNELLQYSDTKTENTQLNRSVNIINSPNVNIKMEQLQSELEACRKLIKIYESELQRKNNQIDTLIELCRSVGIASPKKEPSQLGQNSDNSK